MCANSGHYGVVYKAKFIPMGTPVAVKVIDLKKPQFRGRQLLRLREEIAIMQKITHVRRPRPSVRGGRQRRWR